MPEEIQERCRQADIVSKSMLLQIVRQPSVREMHDLIDKISGEGITREEARRFNRDDASGRRPPRNFTYKFKPEAGDYAFSLRFNRPEVERGELIRALKEVLEQLLQDPDAVPGGQVDESLAGDASTRRESSLDH